MRHFGGWFMAVATMLASLAMIVSTAVTAFAAGAPPGLVPASHGRLSDPTQASGEWGPAVAVILVVAATSVLLLALKGVRQHSSRQGEASSITEATP